MSSSIHNGPQPQQVSNDGVAQFAQQMANKSSGGGAGAEGGEGGNTPFPGFNYYLSKLTNMASLGFIKVKMGTVLNTGIFKQFDSKGFAEGPINKGAANFGAKGGAVSDFLAKTVLTKPDFSKIAPPDLARLEVKDAPIDTSGFVPSSFASAGGRGGGVEV